MAKVPAGRTKACSEKNEGVARKAIAPEFTRLRQNVRFGRKRPMRLHVAQRPLRWHRRRTSEPDEFAQCVGWSKRIRHKHIDSGAILASLPTECATIAAQIKTAVRRADKHRPTFRADEEGREASRAKFTQFVALAVN